MPVLQLRVDQWLRIERMLNGKVGDRRRTDADN